jgi:hypothetical protein
MSARDNIFDRDINLNFRAKMQSSDSSNNDYTDNSRNDHISTQLLEQILLSSQDASESIKQHSTFTQKYKTRT